MIGGSPSEKLQAAISECRQQLSPQHPNYANAVTVIEAAEAHLKDLEEQML